MKKIFFIIGVILTMAKGVQAQTCQVPVSEADEPMMKGKFEPTWESLENNYKVPDWQSLAFGHIGGLNVWKELATGWHVQCISREAENTSIMLNTMVILQNLDSRTCFHCLKQKNGIQTSSFPSIRKSVLNISLP